MSGKVAAVRNKTASALFWLVLAGFLVALLGAFNWNPVALFTWLADWVIAIVTHISTFFSDNPFFRQIVSTPAK